MTAENSRSYKVLLVDDEENIVRSIGRLLLEVELELEVLSANSGSAGVEVLQRHPDVALILSDQRMSGMSGAEFLEKARELAPDAVRMVLTGYADMAATMDAINKGGASRYLTKPWDDDVLCRAVTEGVRQYALLQENRELNLLVERQNRELSEWNQSLKGRVMEQTATIRRQNEELKERNGRVEEALGQTILAFSRLVELHGARLQDHSRNVATLSAACARELGLCHEEVEGIRTAALLHDIGVIGIPPEVLEKREVNMSQEELDLYQQHAVRGQAALDAVAELRQAALLIRHHHERYDGQGFPDRLAGETIPLGSRILALADFIDGELAEAREPAAVRGALAGAEKQLSERLDPALLEPMRRHVLELYASLEPPEGWASERELRPRDLHEGLVISRNLYSGTGLLLLTKGSVLDRLKIAAIARYYEIDPPEGGVFVSRAEEGG